MAFPAAKSGFTLDDLVRQGPDEITRKRKIAEALLAQSQGIHPIANPLEGMAQMAQALIGNLKGARLDRAEREGKEGANALFSAGMGMGEFPAAPGGGASVASGVADGPKGREAYAAPAKANVPANAKDLAGSFIKMGYTPAQAAGIVGNLVQESGLRSTGAVGDSGTAFGLAQWRGDRFTNLKNFAAQQGKSWEDPDVQAQFIHHELGTTEKSAGDRLRAAKTPEEAAAAFIGFERPRGWSADNPTGGHGWSNRLANTMGIVGQLGDSQAPPTQVASLDPAVGMPPAAMLPPAAAAPGQEAIAKALPAPTGYNPATNPANARADAMMANGGAGLNPPPEIAALNPAQVPLPTPAAPGAVPPGAPAAQAPAPQQQQIGQALVAQNDPAQTLGAPAISPQGPDMRTLMNMAGNEFMSPSQQKMIEALTGQRMKQADPEYQLDLETKRAQLDAAKRPAKAWQKLDDDTLFDPVTGETKQIGADTGAAGQFRFKGNSVDAQALNGLMDSGALTPDQAQQIAAGKTVTDPTTGAIIFLTPRGIFSQPAEGGAAQPLAPSGSPVAPAPDAAPPAAGALPAPSNPGAIPVTGGKTEKPTEQQNKAKLLYSVGAPELKIVEDNFNSLSEVSNQMAGMLPSSVQAYATTPQYQRARQSLEVIVQTFLYATSGAQAPEQEVKRWADTLTPRPGEDQQTIADKLARAKNMISAIKGVTGDASLGAPAATLDAPTSPAPSGDDAPPASYTGKFWKYLTPEQRKLWQ